MIIEVRAQGTHPAEWVFRASRRLNSELGAWKEQVPIRPRGPAPAWGALCRVEIAD
jgi:hypothetical protein